MYIVNNQEGNDGPSEFNEQKLEVRWAFADWDKIWGNPTLYLEVANRDLEADVIEGKLLLGGEVNAGWHWGTNFVYEHEMGGEFESVYELTAGVSRVLADEKTSLGGELKTSIADTEADRGDYSEELLVGPSFQYRPTRAIHMDFAALAGIGSDSPELQAFDASTGRPAGKITLDEPLAMPAAFGRSGGAVVMSAFTGNLKDQWELVLTGPPAPAPAPPRE